MDWLCCLAPGLDKTHEFPERLGNEAAVSCVRVGDGTMAGVWGH